MRGIAAVSANRRGRPPGFALAILLSAALHGLSALCLWAILGLRPSVSEDQPLHEVLVSVVDDGMLSLTTLSPSLKKSAAPPVTDDGEEQDAPIEVRPLTPLAVTLSDAREQPHVQISAPRSGETGFGPGAKAAAGATDSRFFGIPVHARRIVFVVDRSTSMWANGGLEAVKRELLAAVSQLPGDARFQVLFYNNAIETLSGAERDGYLAATEQTRRDTQQFVEGLRSAGSTNHFSALRQAIALGPDVIFLATDGEDLRLDQVRDLTDLNRGHAVIHTLEWGHLQQGPGLLKVLAAWNRGTHRRIGPSRS
jgi:hypothetical protein